MFWPVIVCNYDYIENLRWPNPSSSISIWSHIRLSRIVNDAQLGQVSHSPWINCYSTTCRLRPRVLYWLVTTTILNRLRTLESFRIQLRPECSSPSLRVSISAIEVKFWNPAPNTVLAFRHAFKYWPEASTQAFFAMIQKNCHWIAFTLCSVCWNPRNGWFAHVSRKARAPDGWPR